MVDDVNYLAARLHGRRSRLAEAERLEALGRLSDLYSLGRTVSSDAEFHSAADFQQRLVHDLVQELAGFIKYLGSAGAELVSWLLARFQVENIKVLVRAFRRKLLETPQEYLVSLPPDLLLNIPALMGAASLEKFAALLPSPVLRKNLNWALDTYRDQPRSFFLEAALDRCYFQELLKRTEELSGEDKELVMPITLQEIDSFHLMLVVRGRFNYYIPAEQLSPLHVRGSRIPSKRFAAMLTASDIRSAASLAVGRAIDALPPGFDGSPATVDPSELEARAWKRFLRLSNRAFRRSHMGLGAIIGYIGIRRVEVANLITLSEQITTNTPVEARQARLHPRADLESVYV